MSEDLLTRAARLEALHEPTREELEAELEDALDELEERFPDGRPPDRRADGDAVRAITESLEYEALLSRIARCRRQLRELERKWQHFRDELSR